MNRRSFLHSTGLAAFLALFRSCISCVGRAEESGEGAMKSNAVEGQGQAIAACGLNCRECPIGKAAKDREYAEKLAAEWRKSGQSEAVAEWFRCEGCHGNDELVWSEDCKIRLCCIKKKGLANCSYCGEFPCSLIEEFENDGHVHHAKAVDYLKELRKLRIDSS